MKSDIISTLRNELEKVSDSYEDFVDGAIITAKNHKDYAEKLISFIHSNPKATTSDIIKYETEELLGIKPLV